MKLKIFFIIFEEFFECKNKTCLLSHADKYYIYYMNQGIIDVTRCVN